MRRPTLSALVLLLTPAAAAAQAPPLLTGVPGTVLLYRMDEGAGTTVADSSGAGKQGKIIALGFGVAWETGLSGGALNFTDSGAYLEVPSVAINSTWTIQAWTKFPLESNGSYRTLVRNADGHHHILVHADGRIGTFINTFRPAASPGGGDYNIESDVPAGWHLLSVVAESGVTKFYVDGVHKGTSDAVETLPVASIGNAHAHPQAWGLVDCVRILNVARSAADIAVDASVPSVPPVAADLGQFRLNDAPIGVGGAVSGGFVVRGVVTDWLGRPGRLDVEVRPLGSDFSGLPPAVVSSATVASGATASVTYSTLLPGTSYHWRARAATTAGTSSAWTSFGNNLETAADLVLEPNSLPLPVEARQKSGADARDLARGGIAFGAGVIFQATLVDPNEDRVRLEIEVRPAGEAFIGQATASGSFVDSGREAALAVELPPGAYHWQGRSVDEHGAASDWTGLGGGAGFDFRLIANGSSNASPCSGGAGAAAWIALALLPLLRTIRL